MTTVGGKFTTRKRNLVTYLEDKQYELLRELAAANDCSVSAEAAKAIHKYIQEQSEKLEVSISKN
ncbi:MAG: hypothetical protein AB1801_17040 [Chloroflexota bacterium]